MEGWDTSGTLLGIFFVLSGFLFYLDYISVEYVYILKYNERTVLLSWIQKGVKNMFKSWTYEKKNVLQTLLFNIEIVFQ